MILLWKFLPVKCSVNLQNLEESPAKMKLLICFILVRLTFCCLSQREQEEREERWTARREALEGAQRELEREWGAQWREWAEAIAALESRQRELRSRRRILELERRDEMTQVSDLESPSPELAVISVKYQFYLILVALGVLICLSGNIIIYSHVCPLDMWRRRTKQASKMPKRVCMYKYYQWTIINGVYKI